MARMPAPHAPDTANAAPRLKGGLARQLGMAITSGTYRPGDALPNEIDLSQQLGVSRSALREALHTLSAKGLIEACPRAGTRVRDYRLWTLLDPDVLDWCVSGPAPAELMRALQDVRGLFEPAAAALAATHRKPADLTAMREALIAMERAGEDREARLAATRTFRAALLAATGNPVLESLAALAGLSDHTDAQPDYWPLFDAIAAGGPDAARDAVTALVRNTAD